MKKILTFMIITILTFATTKQNTIFATTQEQNNDKKELNISSPSAILLESSTGTILYSLNENQKMYPASMTKMMAIYLFLEKINSGDNSFEETVVVSTLASSMGGSQVFLKEYEEMSFEDLFKAVTIASANDATVALAEHTYGTLNTFIDAMNTRAKEFGMTSTNFVNVTGFHDPNHYTTALDMSIIARKLLSDYGETLLKYTSIYDSYIRQDSSSPFWLVNTNKMLKTYQGMDGLKTGYTSDSGFNLTSTAKRNNLRLISVVMGGKTSQLRNQDTETLLNYGFSNYKNITLYKKGEILTHVDFNNAKSTQTEIITQEDINVIVRKNVNLDDLKITINIFDLDSPKSKNDIIGNIKIEHQNQTLINYNLYPKDDVEKLSFWDLFKIHLKQLL